MSVNISFQFLRGARFVELPRNALSVSGVRTQTVARKVLYSGNILFISQVGNQINN